VSLRQRLALRRRLDAEDQVIEFTDFQVGLPGWEGTSSCTCLANPGVPPRFEPPASRKPLVLLGASWRVRMTGHFAEQLLQ
jgi:hypothetical protein